MRVKETMFQGSVLRVQIWNPIIAKPIVWSLVIAVFSIKMYDAKKMEQMNNYHRYECSIKLYISLK